MDGPDRTGSPAFVASDTLVWPPHPARAAAGWVPSLSGRDVHVWAVHLDGADNGDAVLSTSERQRVAQIRQPVRRRCIAAARAHLRRILGAYLRQAPKAVELVRTEHGRPALAAGVPLQFNMSYSRDIAVVALTNGWCVGIDVESVDPFPEVDSVARLSMTGTELRDFSGLSWCERPTAFYHAWTQKESYAKALGVGTAIRFAAIETRIDPRCRDGLRRLGDPRGPSLTAHHLDPAAGFCGAVAAPGSDWRIHCWRW